MTESEQEAWEKLALLKNAGQLIKGDIDLFHVTGPESFLQVFKDALVRAEMQVKIIYPKPLP